MDCFHYTPHNKNGPFHRSRAMNVTRSTCRTFALFPASVTLMLLSDIDLRRTKGRGDRDRARRSSALLGSDVLQTTDCRETQRVVLSESDFPPHADAEAESLAG